MITTNIRRQGLRLMRPNSIAKVSSGMTEKGVNLIPLSKMQKSG